MFFEFCLYFYACYNVLFCLELWSKRPSIMVTCFRTFLINYSVTQTRTQSLPVAVFFPKVQTHMQQANRSTSFSIVTVNEPQRETRWANNVCDTTNFIGKLWWFEAWNVGIIISSNLEPYQLKKIKTQLKIIKSDDSHLYAYFNAGSLKAKSNTQKIH